MVMRNREAKQKPFNATLTDILQKIFNKLTKKLGSTDVEHLQIILANFSTFANCSDKLFHILLMNEAMLSPFSSLDLVILNMSSAGSTPVLSII